VAKSPEDVDDLMQDGLLAYHRVSGRWKQVQHPKAAARAVLRTAMRNFYRKQYRLRDWENRWLVAQDQPADPIGDAMILRDYLEHLDEQLGATARYVAERLVAGMRHAELRAALGPGFYATLRNVRSFTRSWLSAGT
jgi:DNA-directed RNA polymerase specialized sigma24 family protein